MAKATDTPPSYGEAFSRGNGRPWSLVTITTVLSSALQGIEEFSSRSKLVEQKACAR